MKPDEIQWPCELAESSKLFLMKSARVHWLNEDNQLTLGKDGLNGLFYIQHGLVVLGMPNASKSCPFLVYRTGDWFGGAIIYTRPDFPYSIVGIKEATVVFFPDSEIRAATERNIELYKMLYLIDVDHTREAVELLFASAAMELTQRIAYFLMKVSDRFPSIAGVKPMISLSQTTLAKVLGLSRITLNQQLQRLKRDGIIMVQRKTIHIVDVASLRAQAAAPSNGAKQILAIAGS